MGKRFLTVEEIRELRLQQFDEAVSQVRNILADMDYLNRTTPEYLVALESIRNAEEDLWSLKNFAVKVVE